MKMTLSFFLITAFISGLANAKSKSTVNFSEDAAKKVVAEMNERGGCNVKKGAVQQSCSEGCVTWMKDKLKDGLKKLSKDVDEAFNPKSGAPLYSEIKDAIDSKVNDQLVALKEGNEQFDLVELPRTYFSEVNRMELLLLDLVEKNSVQGKKYKDSVEAFKAFLAVYPEMDHAVNKFCTDNEKIKTKRGVAGCYQSFPQAMLKDMQSFKSRFKSVIEGVDFASISVEACKGQDALFNPYKDFLQKSKDNKFVSKVTSYIDYARLFDIDYDRAIREVKEDDHEQSKSMTRAIKKKLLFREDPMVCINEFNKRFENQTYKFNKKQFCHGQNTKDLIPFLDTIKGIYGKLNSNNYFAMLRMKMLSNAMQSYYKFTGKFPSESDLKACNSNPDFKEGLDKIRKMKNPGQFIGDILENNPQMLLAMHDAAKRLMEIRKELRPMVFDIRKSRKSDPKTLGRPGTESGEVVYTPQGKCLKKECAEDEIGNDPEREKRVALADEYESILKAFPALRAGVDIQNQDTSSPQHFGDRNGQEINALPLAKDFASEDFGISTADLMDENKVQAEGFDKKWEEASNKLKSYYKGKLKGKVEDFGDELVEVINRTCGPVDSKDKGVHNFVLLSIDDLNKEALEYQPQYKAFRDCMLANKGVVEETRNWVNFISGFLPFAQGESLFQSYEDYKDAELTKAFKKEASSLGIVNPKEVAEAQEAYESARFWLGANAAMMVADVVGAGHSVLELNKVTKLLAASAEALKITAQDTRAIEQAVRAVKQAGSAKEAETALAHLTELRNSQKKLILELSQNPAKLRNISNPELLKYMKKVDAKKLEDEIADGVVLERKLANKEEFLEMKKNSKMQKVTEEFEERFGKMDQEEREKLVTLALKLRDEANSEDDVFKVLRRYEDEIAQACGCTKGGKCAAN